MDLIYWLLVGVGILFFSNIMYNLFRVYYYTKKNEKVNCPHCGKDTLRVGKKFFCAHCEKIILINKEGKAISGK